MTTAINQSNHPLNATNIIIDTKNGLHDSKKYKNITHLQEQFSILNDRFYYSCEKILKHSIKFFNEINQYFHNYSRIINKTLHKVVKLPKIIKKAFNSIKKIKDISKVALNGLKYISQISSLPSCFIQNSIISNFSFGMFFLSLSSFFTQGIDLYETHKFCNKIKEKCCGEMIRNLVIESNEIVRSLAPELQTKIESTMQSLKISDQRKIIKQLKKEFLKENPNPEILEKLLNQIKSDKNIESPFIEKISSTIELQFSLTDPVLIQDALTEIDKNLKNINKEKNNINFTQLKRELKIILKEMDPEIIATFNRAAKVTYLNILSDYDKQKLAQHYMLKGSEIQKNSKEMLNIAQSHLNKGEIDKADELLTIHRRKLKGSITYKKNSSSIYVALNVITTLGSALSFAILFGTLPTPLAPIAIATSVVVGVISIALAVLNHVRKTKSEENLKFIEDRMKKQFDQIDPTKLKTDNLLIYENLKTQIQEKNYGIKILNKCKIKSSDDDVKEVKNINAFIKTFNAYAKKLPEIKERVNATYWTKQLKKIDRSVLEYEELQLVESIQKDIKNVSTPIPRMSSVSKNMPLSNKRTKAIRLFNKLASSIEDHTRQNFEIKRINDQNLKDKYTKKMDSIVKTLAQTLVLDDLTINDLKVAQSPLQFIKSLNNYSNLSRSSKNLLLKMSDIKDKITLIDFKED